MIWIDSLGLLDEVVQVNSADAISMAKQLALKEVESSLSLVLSLDCCSS